MNTPTANSQEPATQETRRTPEEQRFFDYFGVEHSAIDWEKAEAQGIHRLSPEEARQAAIDGAPAFQAFVENALEEADPSVEGFKEYFRDNLYDPAAGSFDDQFERWLDSVADQMRAHGCADL
jgi:hypothetical protein